MPSQRIHINISDGLVEELDTAAALEHQTRSGYITSAIVLKIQFDQVIAEQVSDKNSYFNLIKAALASSAIRRRNRAERPDYE